jgi:hypothetical protein
MRREMNANIMEDNKINSTNPIEICSADQAVLVAMHKLQEAMQVLQPFMKQDLLETVPIGDHTKQIVDSDYTDDPVLAELLALAGPGREELIAANYHNNFNGHIDLVKVQGKLMVKLLTEKGEFVDNFSLRSFCRSLRDDIIPYLRRDSSFTVRYIYDRIAPHIVNFCKYSYFKNNA